MKLSTALAIMLYDEDKVKSIEEQDNELVRRLVNDRRKVSNYYKRQNTKG